MKNIFMAFMMFVFAASCTLAGTPPEVVVKAFQQKFPGAENVHWGKEDKSTWEAECNFRGEKISVNFSGDGQWLETETELPAGQLPEKVASSLHAAYPGYSIVGAARIELSSGEVRYEADIKSGLTKKEVLYAADGSIIH